ncbi:hypothetical protein G9A89_004235 [Geosiphon pyriformis]|nr:hypothetical protein G9A89_004235 [Geosiphon pyriformis]
MIYMIPEEEKPISSCILESKLLFNSNSNSNNDDNENNNSSSIQNGNENDNNLNSNSNSEQYITLFDLTKEQKLKWFSDNNESIMSKCIHNTDIKFDLRYPRKDAIKLEPHLHICIDLKIALKISATTIYMLAIEKRVKNQAQIFKAKTTMCELGKIELTNLYIPAKSPKHIKILIYNTTEDILEIPKRTTIEYLSTEVEKQSPNPIPNFPQLCEYVNITSQTIYG